PNRVLPPVPAAPPTVRLDWHGKSPPPPFPLPNGRLVRISTGSPALRLIHGENYATLKTLRADLHSKVMLAYLDPPFFTGRLHQKLTRRRDASGKVLRARSPAFDDRWPDLPSYL